VKIALAASAGGHLTELLRLEEAWKGKEAFFVTTTGVVAAGLQRAYRTRVYTVCESNREHPLRTLSAFASCVRIALRERPDVVISTGAAHGCMMCWLGKLLGARVIWVDSIANVERLSLSGRMVRRVADALLVQWPHLADSTRGIEYHGELV
jgi:UDP-N-acetylglucosamine:LPS N-acetylglucosamine transferase